jgi:hypothetical protein
VNPEHLLRWQGEHLLHALWQVAQGQRVWLSDRLSYSAPGQRLAASTGAPAFLVVAVAALEPLALPAHELRLWRGQYARLLADQPVFAQRQILAHLAHPRWSAVWRYGGEPRCKICMSPLRPLVDGELLEGSLTYQQLCDLAGWQGLELTPSMLSRHKANHPLSEALLTDSPELGAFAAELAKIGEPMAPRLPVPA